VGSLLVLGAGYIGAALAERALAEGHEVTLADNWYATEPAQVSGLEERGARVETVDIRERGVVERAVDSAERIFLLAAQASRPLSVSEPDYTEETNVTGTRRVAEAAASAGVPVVFASSLHVYGASPQGRVGADHPYGAQGDLAHLSKIYGELCLRLYAERAPFDLTILRLGIVYGPSPVEHERPESQTVVDKFRRLARAGERPTVDDGGRATIGVVHVDDVARIFLEADPGTANVAAETVTVADVAALAEGREPAGGSAFEYETPFTYEHGVGDYLRA
jgi:UDP-glucose 4-epimerase